MIIINELVINNLVKLSGICRPLFLNAYILQSRKEAFDLYFCRCLVELQKCLSKLILIRQLSALFQLLTAEF